MKNKEELAENKGMGTPASEKYGKYPAVKGLRFIGRTVSKMAGQANYPDLLIPDLLWVAGGMEVQGWAGRGGGEPVSTGPTAGGKGKQANGSSENPGAPTHSRTLFLPFPLIGS